jgi:hypothetical protein
MPRWLLVSSLLAIAIAFYLADYWFGADAIVIVGFFTTAVGGIIALFGELVGSRFGERATEGPIAPVFRAYGFILLTLGALLLAEPTLKNAASSSEERHNLYAATAVLVALFVIAALVWIFVKQPSEASSPYVAVEPREGDAEEGSQATPTEKDPAGGLPRRPEK